MQQPNLATHQASNCLNQPFPNRDNPLQTPNLFHKLLASIDDDPEFHATPQAPERNGQDILFNKNQNLKNLREKQT